MIYTAICGWFDPPRPDIPCFTDMGPFRDPRWAAKRFKILSHLYVHSSVSIWVDGNIVPVASEAEIITEFLQDGANVGVFAHPYRTTVAAEAEELVIQEKQSREEMDAFLRGVDSRWLSLPLCECGVIVRRNVPEVANMNDHWWSLITRFSIRDQITFPISVATCNGIRLRVVTPDVRNHPMFKYIPHSYDRN